MAKKMLFIFNPKSGKGKIKNALFDIVERFTRADYDVTVYPTAAAGDCTKKTVSSAADFDVVVISGGDGTLNEAISGMTSLPIASRRPIGYIPAGTMNDFASTNNISSSPLDAVDDIINNKPFSYDIGMFNGKRFLYVAAFGAFTDVAYATPQFNKNIFGPAAYFFEGIKSLPKIKGIDVSITTDTGESVHTTASLVLIMNSTSVAGIEFGKFYDIDTADGKFEIVVIDHGVSLFNLPTIISSVKNGKTSINGIKLMSASSAIIKTGEPEKWTLDGEYGGETDYAEFSVSHNAVQFFSSGRKNA